MPCPQSLQPRGTKVDINRASKIKRGEWNERMLEDRINQRAAGAKMGNALGAHRSAERRGEEILRSAFKVAPAMIRRRRLAEE